MVRGSKEIKSVKVETAGETGMTRKPIMQSPSSKNGDAGDAPAAHSEGAETSTTQLHEPDGLKQTPHG